MSPPHHNQGRETPRRARGPDEWDGLGDWSFSSTPCLSPSLLHRNIPSPYSGQYNAHHAGYRTLAQPIGPDSFLNLPRDRSAMSSVSTLNSPHTPSANLFSTSTTTPSFGQTEHHTDTQYLNPSPGTLLPIGSYSAYPLQSMNVGGNGDSTRYNLGHDSSFGASRHALTSTLAIGPAHAHSISAHHSSVATGSSATALPPAGYLQGVVMVSDDSRHRTSCRWGSDCLIMLDDLTPAGITRHLKDYHFGTTVWDDRNRGACEWHGTPCTNRKDMFYAGFGKHIASVHLRSSSCKCQACGETFARADVLARHVKQYCRGRPCY